MRVFILLTLAAIIKFTESKVTQSKYTQIQNSSFYASVILILTLSIIFYREAQMIKQKKKLAYKEFQIKAEKKPSTLQLSEQQQLLDQFIRQTWKLKFFFNHDNYKIMEIKMLTVQKIPGKRIFETKVITNLSDDNSTENINYQIKNCYLSILGNRISIIFQQIKSKMKKQYNNSKINRETSNQKILIFEGVQKENIFVGEWSNLSDSKKHRWIMYH